MTQQETKKKEDVPPARSWWQQLQPSKTDANGYSRGDRAALARLRRCSTWVEAAAEPQTLVLFHKLGREKSWELPRVAVLASVLAHVREDDKSSKVADSIGKPVGKKEEQAKEQAKLSENRLRHLLTATGDDEILTAFRRLVAIMDRKANVADLADNILYWDHPDTGDSTRVKFAFHYWKAGSASPASGAVPGPLAPQPAALSA